MCRPIILFYSYSHEDSGKREAMAAALAVLRHEGLISEWYDKKILAGQQIEAEIAKHMANADIICFLVSRNFLASDPCMKEWKNALEIKKSKKNCMLIPIIVGVCDWKNSKEMAGIMALPQDGRPVDSFGNEDDAWQEVTEGIREVVKKLRNQNNLTAGAGAQCAHSVSLKLGVQEDRIPVPNGEGQHSPVAVASNMSGTSPAIVKVLADGRPLKAAHLFALFPNTTGVEATTDDNGEARINLHTSKEHMKVYVAAPGKQAHCEVGWLPSEGELEVDLQLLPGGGSVIFPNGTGDIPLISGRLEPIFDNLKRTYLYAPNIAINRGEPQAVHFEFGEELHLADNTGAEALIRIVDIVGRVSLIEYWLASQA